MKRLTEGIVNFFQNRGCVSVNTSDKQGFAHSACKGIVKINRNGRVYLLDLYRAGTHDNLRHNPRVSITAFNEHKFSGYCLKGRAVILPRGKLQSGLIRAWEARVTGRITQRLLRNIHEDKGHPRHPEALLPKPEYLIVMDVEEVVDLTPRHLK